MLNEMLDCNNAMTCFRSGTARNLERLETIKRTLSIEILETCFCVTRTFVNVRHPTVALSNAALTRIEFPFPFHIQLDSNRYDVSPAIVVCDAFHPFAEM